VTTGPSRAPAIGSVTRSRTFWAVFLAYVIGAVANLAPIVLPALFGPADSPAFTVIGYGYLLALPVGLIVAMLRREDRPLAQGCTYGVLVGIAAMLIATALTV
jgi:hypothetical protein